MSLLVHEPVPAPATAGAGTGLRPRKTRKPSPPYVRLALGIAFVVLVIAICVFYTSGGRWFMVTTPSMGEAAPVGSLVISGQTNVDRLRAGDIITFHSPTVAGSTYTHRIVANDPAGIRTKGDINGAEDPWVLHQSDLVGRVIAILPGAGWAGRALPLLALGVVALWLATARARPDLRSALRVGGLPLVASAVAFILKPFVSVSILSTFVEHGVAKATVVSTGIMPVRVQIPGGTHADLSAGAVGTISAPPAAHLGHFAISTVLHLQPGQWILISALCALPLLWCLVIGLPRERPVRHAPSA